MLKASTDEVALTAHLCSPDYIRSIIRRWCAQETVVDEGAPPFGTSVYGTTLAVAIGPLWVSCRIKQNGEPMSVYVQLKK